MHKGMLSGLWGLKWVLLCLLLTACKPNPPTPTPPSPEITVTGQIMLGPVLRGHSLQLVIYDPDMKELDRPKIGLDGSYGFTLKDYEGAVIAQVTSTNPQQNCSVGDYIDEATAKPKCLGNNSILSTTVLKRDDSNNENQAKLHTTSVTTIAALSAGISIKEDGTMAVDDNLSPEIIEQSNKTIAQALGLGDQSVAEYTPKSIITTDQKFQKGDAYSQALAEISGIEAEGKSLNSVVKLISAGIGDNGQLAPAVQDMMVKGNQKVFKTAKKQGADTTILNQINKRQDTYPDSISKVDMVNAPEPPVFKNKTKTSNQKPTWEWVSGGTGNNRYQYRFGAEDDIQNVRDWTKTNSSSFTSKDNLNPGKYTLEIQEGHLSNPEIWSMASSSTIEIIANQEGSVTIEGEAIQGKKLKATPIDQDGFKDEVSYQWYRDNKAIKNATNRVYLLTEKDVNKAITVKISYIDNMDFNEKGIQSKSVKIDNIDDKPILTKPKDVVLNEDADPLFFTLEAKDIDNDDKAITYNVESNNSEIVEVTISANKKLQITPKQNQYGEATITVTANSNGLKDEKTFKLIINSIDDKPVLIQPNDVIYNEDANTEIIRLHAYDIDNPIEDITYKIKSIISNKHNIAEVFITDNNKLKITPIENKYGKATITLIAISNGKEDTKSFDLEIKNIDDPPVLSPLQSTLTIEEETTITIQNVVTDIDNDIEDINRTIELSKQIADVNIDKNGNLIIKGIKNKHGSATVNITVRSRDNQPVTNSFQLIIKNTYDSPEGNLKIDYDDLAEGQTLKANTESIESIDGDIDKSTFTYRWSVDGFPQVHNTQKTFLLLPDHVSKKISLFVTFKLTDSSITREYVKQLTLKEPVKDVNFPPVAHNLDLQFSTNDIGETVKIELSDGATDKDDDSLEFIITELPSNGTLYDGDTAIENINHTIRNINEFTYQRDSKEKVIFKFMAFDNEKYSAHANVTITYMDLPPNVESFKFRVEEQKISRRIVLKGRDDISLKGYKITAIPENGDLYKNGEIITSDSEYSLTTTDKLTYKSDSDTAKEDSFKYKSFDGQKYSDEAATVTLGIIAENDPSETTRLNKDQLAEFYFVTDIEMDDMIAPIDFKFQIANDSLNFGVYRYRTLFTDNKTALPYLTSWLKREVDVYEDDDDFYKLDVNFKVDVEDIAWDYADRKITGLEKESLRVLFAVKDSDLIHKEGFILKPTLKIDKKTKRQNNTTWVDVCWQMSQRLSSFDPTNASDPINIITNKAKSKIIQIVTNSWQKNAAIKFDWRNQDQWGDSPGYEWLDPMSNCKESYNTDYPQIKVYLKFKSESDAQHEEDSTTINIDIPFDGEDLEGELFKARLIHEFGHALGFPDEDNRFDTYRSSNTSTSHSCHNSVNRIDKPIVVEDQLPSLTNPIKSISFKKWQLQPYDPLSIMNHCIYEHPYLYESLSNDSNMLSLNDIKKVQQFYGAPLEDSSHLIIDGQFFTGLYLKDNEFHYYENGAKHSDYSAINKSELDGNLQESMYFSLSSNGNKKSVLFKYEPDTDYSGLIEPEKSLLTVCEKPETNSENQNPQQRIQYSLNCETLKNMTENVSYKGALYYKSDHSKDVIIYYCDTSNADNANGTNTFQNVGDCKEIFDFSKSNSSLFIKGIKYENAWVNDE